MTTRACPACGSPHARAAFRIRAYAFRRCSRCATLWVPEPPEAPEIERLYGDRDYFSNPAFGDAERGGFHGYADYLADRPFIEAKFARVLAHVERHVPVGTLLDVGAGPGFMVSAAETRGWHAAGLDVNPWATAFARDRLGLDVRTGGIADADLPDGSFDAVTMMDVIEHVPEPASLVDDAARITREEGILAVLTPDAGALASRLLGRRWPEAMRVPEHLVLFSAAGLATLLEAHGFRPLGRHTVGKTSSIRTLVADASPLAPRVAERLGRALAGRRLAERTFEVDPRMKTCMYARRVGGRA